MTYREFQHQFPIETKAISHFIAVRYPEGVKCNYCGSDKVYQRSNEPRFFDCNKCDVGFSVFTGTIFEQSHIDLCRWFFAIHLFLNGKKGISGYQLQREIGVTYKTAWRMLKQIRTAMGNEADRKLFEVVVEVDETYIGGKPRKGSKNNKRGRGTKKTPVVGVLSSSDKKVIAKVATAKNGKRLTSSQLLSIIKESVSKRALVVTDEFTSYVPLTRHGYDHYVINHSVNFVDGNGVHTNGIESFWATLKRGILGIYHHVSVQHLQHYVNEFCFRYNNRKNVNMFDVLLKQTIAQCL